MPSPTREGRGKRRLPSTPKGQRAGSVPGAAGHVSQLPAAPQPTASGVPSGRRGAGGGRPSSLRLGTVARPPAPTRPAKPEPEVARERGPALCKLPHSRPAAPGPAVRADERAPRPLAGRPQTPRGPGRAPRLHSAAGRPVGSRWSRRIRRDAGLPAARRRSLAPACPLAPPAARHAVTDLRPQPSWRAAPGREEGRPAGGRLGARGRGRTTARNASWGQRGPGSGHRGSGGALRDTREMGNRAGGGASAAARKGRAREAGPPRPHP